MAKPHTKRFQNGLSAMELVEHTWRNHLTGQNAILLVAPSFVLNAANQNQRRRINSMTLRKQFRAMVLFRCKAGRQSKSGVWFWQLLCWSVGNLCFSVYESAEKATHYSEWRLPRLQLAMSLHGQFSKTISKSPIQQSKRTWQRIAERRWWTVQCSHDWLWLRKSRR